MHVSLWLLARSPSTQLGAGQLLHVAALQERVASIWPKLKRRAGQMMDRATWLFYSKPAR